jgi:hypothetical protein
VKSFLASVVVILALTGFAQAGSESYAANKQPVEQIPCPQWYRDNEWNVSIWGAYVFTGENWENDRYLDADHAWGGGIDLKYFFHRYFGIGVEGYVLDATRQTIDKNGILFVSRSGSIPVDFSNSLGQESRLIGAGLGTFTLRYPFPCSRFAPYVWAGGGAIFNGGERDRVHITNLGEGPTGGFFLFHTSHSGSETKAVGQFGGGIEIRLTPHIGWMSDFSWNVVNGPENNFGMARSGVTFAF